jgi:hypothetical protein
MHQPYPLSQQWSRSWPNSGTNASLPAGFSAWNLLLSPPLVQIGRWRPAFLQIEVRHDRTENPGRDESGRRTLVTGGPRAAAEGAQAAGCNGARPTCVVWRRAGGRRVSGAGQALCIHYTNCTLLYLASTCVSIYIFHTQARLLHRDSSTAPALHLQRPRFPVFLDVGFSGRWFLEVGFFSRWVLTWVHGHHVQFESCCFFAWHD